MYNTVPSENLTHKNNSAEKHHKTKDKLHITIFSDKNVI